MATILMLWLAGLANAACDLPAVRGASFAVPVRADRVRLVVEIWADHSPEGWAESLLDVLETRGLSGVVVVSAGPPDPTRAALLARAAERHEVAVWLPAEAVPRDLATGTRGLRASMADLRKSTGTIRAVVAPVGTRATEALLGKAGFRTLLDSSGASTAEPRMAGVFEGQPRINVVLPPGPYEDACGTDPRMSPFSPVAADRSATAIQRANRAPGTPVVVVGLDPERASADDAAVLARWIDEVLTPGGVTVVTADEARLATLAAFRKPPIPPPSDEAGGGRLVGRDQLLDVALALAATDQLERVYPGALNTTEAFLALLHLAAGHTEGDLVRLGSMHGPAQLATSTLSGPTEIGRDALTNLAKALVAALPTEVPSAMSVDGTLLTAGELMLALASHARGDEPVLTRPCAVPEPNERGLGWGEATMP